LADYKWLPEAMLREPYKTADLPCVGEKFKVIKIGKNKSQGQTKTETG